MANSFKYFQLPLKKLFNYFKTNVLITFLFKFYFFFLQLSNEGLPPLALLAAGKGFQRANKNN